MFSLWTPQLSINCHLVLLRTIHDHSVPSAFLTVSVQSSISLSSKKQTVYCFNLFLIFKHPRVYMCGWPTSLSQKESHWSTSLQINAGCYVSYDVKSLPSLKQIPVLLRSALFLFFSILAVLRLYSTFHKILIIEPAFLHAGSLMCAPTKAV